MCRRFDPGPAHWKIPQKIPGTSDRPPPGVNPQAYGLAHDLTPTLRQSVRHSEQGEMKNPRQANRLAG